MQRVRLLEADVSQTSVQQASPFLIPTETMATHALVTLETHVTSSVMMGVRWLASTHVAPTVHFLEALAWLWTVGRLSMGWIHTLLRHVQVTRVLGAKIALPRVTKATEATPMPWPLRSRAVQTLSGAETWSAFPSHAPGACR